MITIIGAGHVGLAAAIFLMTRELDDILLISVTKGKPQGEALDLAHAASILGVSIDVRGSNDYRDMEGSDLVLVTAGVPRQPGMSREELVAKNADIIRDVAGKIGEYAPKSIVILTTNPLDAMTYLMYKRLKWPRSRVIGFSGVLDAGRFRYYIAKRLGVSPASVSAIVLGHHGDKMLPLPRLTTVCGKPLTQLLPGSEIDEIVRETIEAGTRILMLKGHSSSIGPGAGLAVMAEAIKKNLKTVHLASVMLEGEYGVTGLPASVPVVLGREGAERIIELDLTEEEKRKFLESIEAIRASIERIPREYLD